HVRAGGAVPFLRHLFAGVAAPTLDVSATGKNAAADLWQTGGVEPRFTCAVDVVAVIEHETGAVGMPEIFETSYLQAFAVLAVVQVVDHVAPVLKINQVEMKLLPHRIDVADQVLVFLFGPVEITLLINKHGNHSIRPELGPHLFSAQACGVEEVCPPMIVRIRFVLLPLMQRRTAHEKNVFAASRAGLSRNCDSQ